MNVAAGIVSAGLLGLVLFKSGKAKAAMAGFGAGVGTGLSWQEAEKSLRKLFKSNGGTRTE